MGARPPALGKTQAPLAQTGKLQMLTQKTFAVLENIASKLTRSEEASRLEESLEREVKEGKEREALLEKRIDSLLVESFAAYAALEDMYSRMKWKTYRKEQEERRSSRRSWSRQQQPPRRPW